MAFLARPRDAECDFLLERMCASESDVSENSHLLAALIQTNLALYQLRAHNDHLESACKAVFAGENDEADVASPELYEELLDHEANACKYADELRLATSNPSRDQLQQLH
eukprot:4418052-Amphidinium_carterae.1